jgi:phosphopantothenoylcysteine decarboxylase
MIMAKILLGVTGSVAAMKTPELYEMLRLAGHEVKVVATAASLYFFDPAAIGGKSERDRNVVILDEDEWPGAGQGGQYRRGDAVVHIELRKWAGLFLIAPLDANTLAKLAGGLADNCLTCVWRAWDTTRPLVVAPAMNTMMWEHPATRRNLRQLAEDAGMPAPANSLHDDLIGHINRECPLLRIVPPQCKRLACDDVGIGALADLDDILAAVHQFCPPT